MRTLLAIFSVVCPLTMVCLGLARRCLVCTRWAPRRCRGWLQAQRCRSMRSSLLLPGLITAALLTLGR